MIVFAYFNIGKGDVLFFVLEFTLRPCGRPPTEAKNRMSLALFLSNVDQFTGISIRA